jgi:hypothetical protein
MLASKTGERVFPAFVFANAARVKEDVLMAISQHPICTGN